MDNSPSFDPPNSSFKMRATSTKVGKVPGPRKSILSRRKLRRSLKSSAINNKRLFSQSLILTPNKCQYTPNTFNNSASKSTRRSVRFDDTINVATYKDFPARIIIKEPYSLSTTSIQYAHKCVKCSNSYASKRALNIHISAHSRMASKKKIAKSMSRINRRTLRSFVKKNSSASLNKFYSL